MRDEITDQNNPHNGTMQKKNVGELKRKRKKERMRRLYQKGKIIMEE